MAEQLKTAILGATGYSGLELTRLLGRHPRTEPPLLLQRSTEKGASNGNGHTPVGGTECQPFSWSALEKNSVELLFLATPHAVSRELVPEAIARGLRVVDLSGAWRLREEENRAVYGFKDVDAKKAEELTLGAAYGLPELNADRIKTADLVANP